MILNREHSNRANHMATVAILLDAVDNLANTLSNHLNQMRCKFLGGEILTQIWFFVVPCCAIIPIQFNYKSLEWLTRRKFPRNFYN